MIIYTTRTRNKVVNFWLHTSCNRIGVLTLWEILRDSCNCKSAFFALTLTIPSRLVRLDDNTAPAMDLLDVLSLFDGTPHRG